MARQKTTPVAYSPSIRPERGLLMSSGYAGRVIPVGYVPLLPGDSASGRVAVDVSLAEMPRPLLNSVFMNVQAWCVPKSSLPQFFGKDDLAHAMSGEPITTLGQADRPATPFFTMINGAALTTAVASEFAKTLGLHIPTGLEMQSDLIDSFINVYNFRLAAHSSRLPLRAYASEDIAEATTLPPAFWPSGPLSDMVPDYERALVIGALDLDVSAGRLPVGGIYFKGTPTTDAGPWRDYRGPVSGAKYNGPTGTFAIQGDGQPAASVLPAVFAEMQDQMVTTSLADIDKARVTQSFAKLRTAYAGNETTGYSNDDTLVALLMQGLDVVDEQYRRPWLLDSKRVPVGFVERHATDSANLDASVTTGRSGAVLSINVPRLDVGATLIFTLEVLPERIDERMSDPWLSFAEFDALPNALRDIQRVEPVDMVLKRRIDAKHTDPGGLYGYEPMNAKWRRDYTRLGGDFYQPNPGNPWSEQRAAIWMAEIVDPEFTDTHYLAPYPFPNTVFSDTAASSFEFVARHDLSIVGLTQMGDALSENNDDWGEVENAGLDEDTVAGAQEGEE